MAFGAWWDTHVLPRAVELSLRGHEVGELRAAACADLRGSVLQPGFGSGLDLRFLPTAVTEVGAVEPSDKAWEMSQRRRDRSSTPVNRIGLNGEEIAAESDSYDAALISFTLCTIPDVAAALAEIVRVVRPGGRLAFVEHGLSPSPSTARWQHRLDPMQKRVAGGCHLTRDPVALIEAAGGRLLWVETTDLAGPRISRPWTHVSYGVARLP